MTEDIGRLIQIGIVTDTDTSKGKVRVKFQDTDISSDWLTVLRNSPSVEISEAGEHKHTVSIQFEEAGDHGHVITVAEADTDSHTHSVEIKSAGKHSHRSSAECDGTGKHTHTITITAWMPKVNDTVLVVYLPLFNSDGFVIGGV